MHSTLAAQTELLHCAVNQTACFASEQLVRGVFYEIVGTESYNRAVELTKWTLSPQWSISLFLILLPTLLSMQMRQDNHGELGLEQKSDIQLPFSAERGKKDLPVCREWLSNNALIAIRWRGNFRGGVDRLVWCTSKKSGLTPSPQAALLVSCGFLSLYYFSLPAALCSLFFSFFYIPICSLSLTHSHTHKHARTPAKLISIPQCLFCVVNCPARWPGQIQHKGKKRGTE